MRRKPRRKVSTTAVTRLGPPMPGDVAPATMGTALRRVHDNTARAVLRVRNCGPRGPR